MSIKEETLKILSDGKWHCTKCELPAAQAKTYQQLRIKDGYEFETDKKILIIFVKENIVISAKEKQYIER